MPPSSAEDFAPWLEGIHDGWMQAMGVRIARATEDEVCLEVTLGPQHRQPLGVVHGGVHSGLVEAAASVGANLGVFGRGCMAVGLENHTSFLHAVRGGTLRATARPLQRGLQTHVWEVHVDDDRSRLVATGRVRLLVIERGSRLGGKPAVIEPVDRGPG